MFLYFPKHYKIIRKEKEEGTKLSTEIAVLIIFFGGGAYGTLRNGTLRNGTLRKRLCETVLCE